MIFEQLSKKCKKTTAKQSIFTRSNVVRFLSFHSHYFLLFQNTTGIGFWGYVATADRRFDERVLNGS